MSKIEYGIFCEVYGKTLRNRVLEFVLERTELDFAVSDIFDEIDISKPKVYQIFKELEDEGIIRKSRVVRGTQLYVLDQSNKKANLLRKNFKECLKLVLEEMRRESAELTKNELDIVKKFAQVCEKKNLFGKELLGKFQVKSV